MRGMEERLSTKRSGWVARISAFWRDIVLTAEALRHGRRLILCYNLGEIMGAEAARQYNRNMAKNLSEGVQRILDRVNRKRNVPL